MAKINWSIVIYSLAITLVLLLTFRSCKLVNEAQTQANYWNHYGDSVTHIEKRLVNSNDSLNGTMHLHDSTSKKTIDSLSGLVDAAKIKLNQKIKEISGIADSIRLYESNNDTPRVYIACDSLMGELTQAHYLVVYYQEMVDTTQNKLKYELSWRDSAISKLQQQVQGFRDAYTALRVGQINETSAFMQVQRKQKADAVLAKIGWGLAALLGTIYSLKH